jgi:hypothetical protein
MVLGDMKRSKYSWGIRYPICCGHWYGLVYQIPEAPAQTLADCLDDPLLQNRAALSLPEGIGQRNQQTPRASMKSQPIAQGTGNGVLTLDQSRRPVFRAAAAQLFRVKDLPDIVEYHAYPDEVGIMGMRRR